jgi:hypothetical protein
VRAIDYLPPLDITFTSFLDAVVAADTDLYPEDRDGFRRLFVESCRRRGVYPSTLPGAIDRPTPDYTLWEPLPTRQALIRATQELEGSGHGPGRTGRPTPQLERAWSTALLEWGRRNAARLGLDAHQLEIDGGNASFRVNENGFPTAVVSARFTQRQTDPVAGPPATLIGVPLIGGTTFIAEGDGDIRHVVHRPVPGRGADGSVQLSRFMEQAIPAPRPPSAASGRPPRSRLTRTPPDRCRCPGHPDRGTLG